MKRTFFFLFLISQLTLLFGGDPFVDLASFRYGKEGSVRDLLQRINQAKPYDAAALEEGLLGVISSKSATPEGKALACGMLRLVASDKSISLLSELLLDEQLSDCARMPLENINSSASRQALRNGLGKAPQKLQIGILGSLAACRDREAVEEIEKLVSDPVVSAAAIRALGSIGGPNAACALIKFNPGKTFEREHLHALMDCAATIDSEQALSICEKVLASKDAFCQSSILMVLAKAKPEKAASLAEQWIKGADVTLREGAFSLLAAKETDGKILERIVSGFDAFNPQTKAGVLIALGAGRHQQGVVVVKAHLRDLDPVISGAALEAAAKIADEETVDLLLGLENPKAAEALAIATGDFVEQRLIAALANTAGRDKAVQALVSRRSRAAVPVFIQAISQNDPQYRALAWRALETIAPAESISELWRLFQTLADPKEKTQAIKTLKAVCSKAPDRKAVFEVLAASYADAPVEVKGTLIELASEAASPAALGLAREALSSGNPDLRAKAVRSLAAWTNVSAAPALLELTQKSSSSSERILALRGYIRLAGMEPSRKGSSQPKSEQLLPDQQVIMFEKAAELAVRNEEKLLLLSSIKSVRSEGILPVLKLFLEDQSLSSEAELASLAVLGNLFRSNNPEVKEMVKRLSNSSNQSVSQSAQALLAKLPK